MSWEIAKLLSRMTVACFIPTSSVQGFDFRYNLVKASHFSFFNKSHSGGWEVLYASSVSWQFADWKSQDLTGVVEGPSN